MRIMGFMNGWKDAPHCWRHHIFYPFVYRKVQDEDDLLLWHEIKLLGFVVFFEL